MPYIYKTDLIAPSEVEAYKTANAKGSQIVLPDLKDPNKRITYLVEEVEIQDTEPHPVTKELYKSVTLRLKQA